MTNTVATAEAKGDEGLEYELLITLIIILIYLFAAHLLDVKNVEHIFKLSNY